MYIYSLLAVILTVWAARHIRKQTPFPVLCFAYFYLLDSVVNMTYATLFAATWFLITSPSQDDSAAPSGSMIDDLSGPVGGNGTVVAGVMPPESATSIAILCLLWIVRAYFCVVVMAYARQVVRNSATGGVAPFTGKNGGEGWRGRGGRRLVGGNKGYWEVEEGVGGKGKQLGG